LRKIEEELRVKLSKRELSTWLVDIFIPIFPENDPENPAEIYVNI